jgi:DNA-binding NarL/FixJ family response regulator
MTSSGVKPHDLIAARAIRADRPETGVPVLSQYVEPGYAMRLIQDHPERVGYLLKERVFDIATVVDALRRIVDGKRSSIRRSSPVSLPGRRTLRLACGAWRTRYLTGRSW